VFCIAKALRGKKHFECFFGLRFLLRCSDSDPPKRCVQALVTGSLPAAASRLQVGTSPAELWRNLFEDGARTIRLPRWSGARVTARHKQTVGGTGHEHGCFHRSSISDETWTVGLGPSLTQAPLSVCNGRHGLVVSATPLERSARRQVDLITGPTNPNMGA